MPWLLDATNEVTLIRNELPSVLFDAVNPPGENPGVGLLTEDAVGLVTEDGVAIFTEGNPS